MHGELPPIRTVLQHPPSVARWLCRRLGLKRLRPPRRLRCLGLVRQETHDLRELAARVVTMMVGTRERAVPLKS